MTLSMESISTKPGPNDFYKNASSQNAKVDNDNGNNATISNANAT
jgi:hypothetical protein